MALGPDFFENDRPWLAAQPGMSSWDSGCGRLLELMQGWLMRYSTALCCEPVVPEHQRFESFIGRVWGCWLCHWKLFVKSSPEEPLGGETIARNILAGIGSERGRKLGGNVVRDIVLAEAVLWGDQQAIHHLQSEQGDFIRRQGWKFHFRSACDDDWEQDLWVELLRGYDDQSGAGKLKNYDGRSGLRNWLGTVVRRFVCDRSRGHSHPVTLPDDLKATDRTEERVISEECRKRFEAGILTALSQLEKTDRTILALIHGHGWEGKDVASVVGLNAGNVSRRRQKALKRLKELLQAPEDREEKHVQGLAECLEHWLIHARQEFGESLMSALVQQAPDL